jgi:hypothetical protein
MIRALYLGNTKQWKTQHLIQADHSVHDNGRQKARPDDWQTYDVFHFGATQVGQQAQRLSAMACHYLIFEMNGLLSDLKTINTDSLYLLSQLFLQRANFISYLCRALAQIFSVWRV